MASGSVSKPLVQNSLPTFMSLVSSQLLPTVVYYAPIGNTTFQVVGNGVLGLIIDRKYRATYIRVYDANSSISVKKDVTSITDADPSNDTGILMQFELYTEIGNKLTFLTSTFVSMEADNGIVGFAFQNQTDSEEFVNQIMNYLPTPTMDDPTNNNHNNTVITNPVPIGTKMEPVVVSSINSSTSNANNPHTPSPPLSKKPFWSHLRFRRQNKEKKSNTSTSSSSLNTAAPMDYVIGDIIPGSFKHTGHIGFNDTKRNATNLSHSHSKVATNKPENLAQNIENLPTDIKQGLKALGLKKKDILKDPILYESIIALSTNSSSSSITESSLVTVPPPVNTTTTVLLPPINIPTNRSPVVTAPVSVLTPSTTSTYSLDKPSVLIAETSSVRSDSMINTLPSSAIAVVPLPPPPPLPVRRRASLGNSSVVPVVSLPKYQSTASDTSNTAIVTPKVMDSASSALIPKLSVMNTNISSIHQSTFQPSISTIVTDTKSLVPSLSTVSKPSFLGDIQTFSKQNLRPNKSNVTTAYPSLQSSLVPSGTRTVIASEESNPNNNDMMNKLKQMVQNRRSVIRPSTTTTERSASEDEEEEDSDSDW